MARPHAVENIAVTVKQAFDAAQSRRRVEDRLRVALVAGRMAAWEWDPSTDIVTPPEALTAIFGTTGTNATRGADFSALIHPPRP
jgi:PAS domain-containing protein